MRKLLLSILFLSCAASAAHALPLKVVASQTFYADLVKKIGGDRVEVSAVAPPRFNVHFIEPRPSDVRKTAKADLFVFTGLDLELWADPLLEAAGRPDLFRGGERNLDLSVGIELGRSTHTHGGKPSRSEGDIHLFGNPHYHMDPRNSAVMARSISAKLSEIDAEGAAGYERNLSNFLSELEKKNAEWKALCAHCAGQAIVSYHADIDYLASFLGLETGFYLEPKPGIPPTPRHLVSLEEEAKEHGVRLITMPTYYPRTAAETLAAKIGAKVALIANSPGELQGTEDIFSFFDHNIAKIAEALR